MYSLLLPPSSYIVVKHADSEKRTQAFETKCLRKLLRISDLSTRPVNGCGARSAALWVHRNLFWQLSGEGSSRGSGMSPVATASKTILQGTLECGRRRGWQRKSKIDNIEEWISHARIAHNGRKDLERISADSSVDHIPPMTQSTKELK